MNSLYRTLTFFLLLVLLPGFYFTATDSYKKKSRILINDDYNYIAVNQIKMWFSNNGDGSHDPLTDGNGLYWPGGADAVKSAVFEDGLIFSGKIGDEIRTNGNTHRQGLQAGKIISGIPDDPSLPKYRIYKILKGWETLPPGEERDKYEADYNNWPVEDGAPWIDIDGDGIYTPGTDEPRFIGDETAWYVANDMDPSRSTFTYGTMPMGIEFQTTIFAFKDQLYEDMVFKKYLMINKGGNTLDSMYVGYWADVDLGDASDDYSGCDTLLDIGYTYNADNMDGNGSGSTYGADPPAIGYDLLQGPVVPGSLSDSARIKNKWIKGYRNLRMTSFVMYIGSHPVYRDPQQGVPAGAIQMNNYLKGISWAGTKFIDPNNNQVTRTILAGDPVTGTGWYEGAGWPGGPAPSDRRQLMSSGPFTFAPGDTQEVIIGIVIGRGTSNINSIQVMKEKDIDMKRLYRFGFEPTLVDVRDDINKISGYHLYQNYPNPFNPETIIKFTLPERAYVSLRIYDLLGKDVKVLINSEMDAGFHSVKITASDLASGLYIYSLEAGSFRMSRKMILMK
jgi:hypothetical protein